MAGTMYVAAIEERDGVTYEYVLHASSISDAERTARAEARRRDATLVDVQSAVLADARRRRRRRKPWRLGSLALAVVLLASVTAGTMLLLIQALGSA
jgi:hypothetical protein